MSVRFHLLPWDQPLLKRAVDWLAGDWQGGGPLDLSDLLVVAPTRQSGRRLREALAVRAAGRGQAVFPPRVMLPEDIVAPGAAAADVASPMESLLAWIEVLRGLDLAAFREVFPVDPPARNFSWALRLADELGRLQKTLGEAGLSLADAPAKGGDDFPEAARWRQLAQLEQRRAAQLARWGKRDVQAARIAFAQSTTPPSGISRIVLLATPDPLPLAVSALAARARALPVDVVVFGPPGGESLFDEWGRPRIEAWSAREIELPDFERQVHLCADPAAQAERVADCARRYGAPDGLLAVGVADADVLPYLETSLTRSGFAVFNPEGRPRRREGFYVLIESLAEFARSTIRQSDPGFAAVTALVRCPDVLAWLGERPAAADPKFSPARLLAGLDAMHRRHLPPTLKAAQSHAPGLAREFTELAPALEKLAALHATLATGKFPANVLAALAVIFGGRRIIPGRPEDARLADLAEAWRDILQQAGRAAPQAGALATEDWWELALRLYGDDHRFEDKPAGAVELQGWLELLWEDAPHLVITGFNDERVPEAVVGDPFLPEALRERLGLKTNAARFARDAYLLQAMAACRAPAGRLDLMYGKVSAAGDPLRPSRLLLRCSDAELPARVERLFRPVAPARPSRPWARAWRLRPRPAPPPARLSVTALRDYLACPFRFYLRHVLRMERVDPAKTELDPLDFGTLVHGALQQLGDDAGLRDCDDAARLEKFLLERFETAVRARYGAELTVPLIVQFESARQRLRAAAGAEARERAAGWRTGRMEWKFAFQLAGLTLTGKIDRIDRHADGRVRVLDYKTRDTAKTPEAAHLRPVRPGDDARPDWLCCRDAAGRPKTWADLQLPLYRRAVAAEEGGAVACGYFNLPKAAAETAVKTWDDFTPDLQAAAERCAAGAAAAAAAGKFWPPVEIDPRRDDEWAGLFHQGTAASVAWKEDA